MMRNQSIKKRGGLYHLRVRTPKRYHGIERRREVSLSLQTDSFVEACARGAICRRNLQRGWEARLQGRDAPSLLRPWAGDGLAPLSAGTNASAGSHHDNGRLRDLLDRLERIVGTAASDPAKPPAPDLPRTLVSEMPAVHERVRADRVSVKNPRQLREWRNKYLRAMSAFLVAVGDKPVSEISAADARAYRAHWEGKRTTDSITTEYVNKQINYMEQLVDSFHKEAGLLPADCSNVFAHLALEKSGAELRQEPGRKLALPAAWIRDTLLDPDRMGGLNAEARDIAIVCAETGARGAEVVDLAPEDIVLAHDIPHLRITMVEEGEMKRELKNVASRRQIPLLGHALEAMRRHPLGFPRYRGKATYSVAVNKYLREGKLFPEAPPGSGRGHSIGGTRHAYEDRLLQAGLSNEERGLMMGHSLRALRGRPVYGAGLELQVRALLAEKVVFPTRAWTPRPHAVLDAEIDRLATEAGFRRR